MRALIDRKSLIAALQAAKAQVELNTTIAVTTAGKVLVAFDAGVSARIEVPCQSDTAIPGSWSFQAGDLVPVLRKLSSYTFVQLAAPQPGRLVVTAGQTVAAVPAEEEDGIPGPATSRSWDPVAHYDAQDLVKACKRALPFLPKAEDRYGLSCLAFRGGRAISSDGLTLLRQDLSTTETPFTLPPSAVRFLAGLKALGEASVQKSGSRLRVTLQGVVLETKEDFAFGEFPDYRSVIPANPPRCTLTTPRGGLQEALARAGLAGETTRLQYNGTTLQIRTKDFEGRTIDDDLPCDVEGEWLGSDLGVNPTMLLHAVRLLPRKGGRIELHHELGPVVLHVECGLALVMPVRLD
jgi:DNA polymerase III sliding clamp (beta) subunit (PCNA family)